jgi:SecD/SecF fusion protein
MLIGIISGTYSSIFIASPVLTAWKEREPGYIRRRLRIAEVEGGLVPAYADGAQVAMLAKDDEAEEEVAPEEIEIATESRRKRRGGPVATAELTENGDDPGSVVAPEPQDAPEAPSAPDVEEPAPAPSTPANPESAERRKRNEERREKRAQRRKGGRRR